MSEHVRYITNEQGERVGVLLDMEAYQKLANFLALDSAENSWLIPGRKLRYSDFIGYYTLL
jgi:phosphopantothenoylcysteine synthetase/decarboxylase